MSPVTVSPWMLLALAAYGALQWIAIGLLARQLARQDQKLIVTARAVEAMFRLVQLTAQAAEVPEAEVLPDAISDRT